MATKKRVFRKRKARPHVAKPKRAYTQYASGFEKTVAKDMQDRGIPFEYEQIVIEYFQVRSYNPDFQLPNGIIVETKGKFTSQDRTKHLLVRAQHPEYDIRLVFMRDNYLSKKSKKKYSDWCNRNNIKWALNRVPQEWVDEDVR